MDTWNSIRRPLHFSQLVLRKYVHEYKSDKLGSVAPSKIQYFHLSSMQTNATLYQSYFVWFFESFQLSLS